MNSTNKPTFFIHANGFLPKAYSPMFNLLNNKIDLKYYLLQNLLKSNNSFKLKNWIPFHEDFINIIKNNNRKIIGMGHSIGGNIILRAALTNPNLFSKIVLLDPTLFIPRIIFFWKLFYYIGLQNKFHPFLNNSLNRKMVYENYEQI